jgi:GNAT superfamily N-acetyltransferase
MVHDDIVIEPFKPEYREDFKRLNIEWLEKYFEVEPHDIEVLSEPERFIIEPGGEIFFTKLNGNVVGTCAVAKIDDHTFELAKMAVTEAAQGRGLGRKLALAVIERARQCGAKKIFLESNSKLSPALRLYRSVGFAHVPRPFTTIYVRADVYMELDLTR